MGKFKHWKEAEKKITGLEAEIKSLSDTISANELTARSEETETTARDNLITQIQTDVTKRSDLEKELGEAVTERDDLKNREKVQFGLLDNLSTERISERNEKFDTDVLMTREYELAWAKYVKTGDEATVRSLINTQTPETAGILIPTTLVNKIEDKLKNGGRLLKLCSIENIKGITTYPIIRSKTDPAVHKEINADGSKNRKVEKDVKITSISISAEFIAETLATTRKFESDSISAFWSWLKAELPDALLRVIDTKIIYGLADGSEGIRGILTNENANGIEFVRTLPNYELDFNVANSAVALLDDGVEDNITVVMNKITFFNSVMGLKDTTGRPIFQVMTDNTGKPKYYIGGYPVEFNSQLPSYDAATAGETYMLVGDFKAMKINFPNGFNPILIRDEITEMKDNIINYLSEIYVGGNITKLGSFIKVTK